MATRRGTEPRESIEDYVRRHIVKAPPLSAVQRAQLTILFGRHPATCPVTLRAAGGEDVAA